MNYPSTFLSDNAIKHILFINIKRADVMSLSYLLTEEDGFAHKQKIVASVMIQRT